MPTSSSEKSTTPPAQIGVLIRTKDRPLCLKRALTSLSQQSFKNFQIYVLNDGGNRQISEGLVTRFSKEFLHPPQIIHNPSSKGRGAASAALIAQAKEEFLHLHDDDDTIEPEFYAKTVDFLEIPKNNNFIGVVVSNYDVFETTDGTLAPIKRIQTEGERTAKYIDLICFLSRDSVVIPITLLFRRSALEKSGNVNPKFNYLEDYDLFLRLLLHGDFGIISEPLASYHQRDNTGSDYDTARSISSTYDHHNFFNEKFREALLKNDETSKLFAIAMLQKHNREQMLLKMSEHNSFFLDIMKNIFGQYSTMLGKMRILEEKYTSLERKLIEKSEEK